MEHPEFENAGQQAGMEIWVINKFEPVPVDRSLYGKFYNGDSYIVLKTTGDDSSTLKYDIHFWLGIKTTQDEKGAAAILTVTLDDQLGGKAVQHREVQGHESSLFLGYFLPAIRYLEGGNESGFNEVETNAGAEKRLLKLSGCDNMRIEEVPADSSSLSRDNCFILEVEHDIFVLVPEGAKATLKRKIISVANNLRDDNHNGRATIEIIDEFSSASDIAMFFDALGSGSMDDLVEEKGVQPIARLSPNALYLYKVLIGDVHEFEEISKPFKQGKLTTEDIFILDTPYSGVYIWLGSNVDFDVKKNYYEIVQQYLDSKGYPNWMHVTRVTEGAESSTFKQYFHNWDTYESIKFTSADIGYFSDEANDGEDLAKIIGKSAAARGYMPDHGSGAFTVFRAAAEPEDVTESQADAPKFYESEVYAVNYQYKDENDEDANVVYLWIGKEADDSAKMAGVEVISKIEEELDGNVAMVKIPQGKEIRHFLNIFNGKLMILCGSKENDYKPENFKKSYDEDGVRLFKVEGTKLGEDMRAIQVEESSSSLAYDDVFILETSDKVYLWIGKESLKQEREAAKNFVGLLIGDEKEIEEVEQGEEPEEFWNILGGVPEEDENKTHWRTNVNRRVTTPPTLTAATVTVAGRIKFEELPPKFTQEDLSDDGAYILDNGEELYLWLGQNIPERVKEARLKIISQYIEDDDLERTVDTAIVVTLKQGIEPAIFKKMFPTWDNDLWQNMSSYEDMKNETKSHNTK
ncbi:gelsolin-like [Melitaea cinxia]|uniref:gelsolin-like n=1 Tax=Melitaea cinxia TaxID=113334 RepID=UPI001E2701F1|nr:gelsolin-like [Melitaea cinxia]